VFLTTKKRTAGDEKKKKYFLLFLLVKKRRRATVLYKKHLEQIRSKIESKHLLGVINYSHIFREKMNWEETGNCCREFSQKNYQHGENDQIERYSSEIYPLENYEGLEKVIGKKREDDDIDSKNSNGLNEVLKVALLGQMIAISNACTGAASTTLKDACKINSPAVQSGCMYFILSTFIIFLPRKSVDESEIKERERKEENNNDCHVGSYLLPFTKIQLQAPWYFYTVLAFLDLQANYVTYFAYRYTSFTSIALLDSLSIPSVMLFSRCLLNRRYHFWHYVGILICLIGFIITLNSDFNESPDTNHSRASSDRYLSGTNQSYEQDFPHAFLGDLLAIIGAILYGLNDTLTELSVKKFSFTEYLGMLGLFGMVFSSIQILILEPNTLSTIFQWNATSNVITESSICPPIISISLLAWNGISLTLFYTGASYFLLHHDAALLDLSLLTTNLYAILFVVWSENYVPPHLSFYLYSVGLVIAGVFVYEKGSSFSFSQSSRRDEIDVEIHRENKATHFEEDRLTIDQNGGYNSINFVP